MSASRTSPTASIVALYQARYGHLAVWDLQGLLDQLACQPLDLPWLRERRLCGQARQGHNQASPGTQPSSGRAWAVARELMEEGCAQLLESRLIGCQRSDDDDHPDGRQRYYQTRFWARVRLLDWQPQHETYERRLVAPEEFLSALSWGDRPTARLILDAGELIESQLRA